MHIVKWFTTILQQNILLQSVYIPSVHLIIRINPLRIHPIRSFNNPNNWQSVSIPSVYIHPTIGQPDLSIRIYPRPAAEQCRIWWLEYREPCTPSTGSIRTCIKVSWKIQCQSQRYTLLKCHYFKIQMQMLNLLFSIFSSTNTLTS